MAGLSDQSRLVLAEALKDADLVSALAEVCDGASKDYAECCVEASQKPESAFGEMIRLGASARTWAEVMPTLLHKAGLR